MARARPHHLGAIVLLLGLAGSAVAQAAAGTVAVLGVKGVGGPHFLDQLEQDLSELYEVLPGDVYRSAADRLGQRGASPDEVRAVCTSLRVDAIVAGAVSGDGKARHLVMTVREGASGRVVARGNYDLSGRTLPLMRDTVLRDLVRVFERVRRIPKRGQKLVEAAPSEPESEPQGGEEPLPTAQVIAHGPASTRLRRGLYAGVGPALMSRSLSFDVATAPGYRGGAVAAIRADGAVFPIALSTELADAHPVLASFGIYGSYERALGLVSTTPLGSASGSASRFSVLLVGCAPLGKAAQGGVLTVETGYQEVSWVSDSQTALGVPNVGYGLFDFGLGWEHALGTPVVALAVRIAALGLIDAGAISTDTQYGPTTGGGMEADLGLTVRPRPWLWLRAGARYTPLFLRFAAAGARFAHSATDQFVDATLAVGFAL